MVDLKSHLSQFNESRLERILADSEALVEAQERFAEVMDRRATTLATASVGMLTIAISLLAFALEASPTRWGISLGAVMAALWAFRGLRVAQEAMKEGEFLPLGSHPKHWAAASSSLTLKNELVWRVEEVARRIDFNERQATTRSRNTQKARELVLFTPLMFALGMVVFHLFRNLSGSA